MGLKGCSKKGSITDLPYLMVGIFSFGVIILLVTFVLNSLNTNVQSSSIFTTESKTASSTMTTSFPKTVDGMILIIFFFLVILSLVLASLVAVSPVFIIFFIIELLIMIFVGGVISNTYGFLIEQEIFATEYGLFPISIHFFRYFPFIIGVVGMVIAFVMYKSRQPLMY